MTFDEYIQNPMGIKNAVFSHREMYRELYKNKFNKIMLREAGNLKYKLFKGLNNFYVYFKIPSEVIENFYYDVVIEFIPANELVKNDNSLSKYNIRFYSNDPSFVYTFAHAMKSNNMFINDLSSKMSKIALNTLAKERNPSNQPGYVKSIYFAYLAMKTFNLFDKRKFISEGNLYNKSILLSMIMDADKKVALRQEAGNSKNKKARIAKQKNNNDTEKITSNHNNRIKNVKNSMFTKSVNKIGSVKKINRTKKI